VIDMTVSKLQRLLTGLITTSLLVVTLLPLTAHAAQITGRKLTLSTSSPSAGATVTYTFNFTVPTTGTVVQSWAAQICDAASGTCNTPGGFTNSSSISQPTGLGDTTGWTGNTATADSLRMSKSGNATNPSGSQTVVFNNVTNPNTANQTFYARITTYSGASWTGVIDSGTVAASTATQIQLSGTMDETLVFCTGGTITGTNCGTATSGSVAFGTNFSSTATSTATSHMVAATNAAGGYVVAVSGSTLTCSGCSGTPNIAALTAGGASSTGSAQFGLNVVSNATPSVGAAVSPSSNGSNLRGQGLNGYGTADSFKFNSGDTIANSGNASLGPTDAQNYTVSYIANVPASQAAGAYTSTLTYICTATF
jgi:hypothetical protein